MRKNQPSNGEAAQAHNKAQIDWAKYPDANEQACHLVEEALHGGCPIRLQGALPTKEEALANLILATHRADTEAPARPAADTPAKHADHVQPPDIRAAERCEACVGNGHFVAAGGEKITCPKCQGCGRKPAPTALGKMSARLKQLAGTKPARIAGEIIGAVALIAAGAVGMAVYKGRQTA